MKQFSSDLVLLLKRKKKVYIIWLANNDVFVVYSQAFTWWGTWVLILEDLFFLILFSLLLDLETLYTSCFSTSILALRSDFASDCTTKVTFKLFFKDDLNRFIIILPLYGFCIIIVLTLYYHFITIVLHLYYHCGTNVFILNICTFYSCKNLLPIIRLSSIISENAYLNKEKLNATQPKN